MTFSQIGMLSNPISLLSSASSSKFCFSDLAALAVAVVVMCLRREVEALSV